MKTAHPQSLPPGVSGSGGISRSTKASTAAPSSGVKNTHGPSLAAWGGSPANGRQGNPPPAANVRAPAARATSSIAVEGSNARRLGSPADGLASRLAGPQDPVLTGAVFVNIAFPSGLFQSAAGCRRFDVYNGANDPSRVGPSKFLLILIVGGEASPSGTPICPPRSEQADRCPLHPEQPSRSEAPRRG